MLRGLGVSAVCEKRHAAAAHDAVVLWKKGAQLMLMMLGVGEACQKTDALLMLMVLGVGASCRQEGAQPMLRMLGVDAACGQQDGQLCP